MNTFPYSGHATLMGKHARPWQDTRFVLSAFGKRISESRKHYLAYVEAGHGQHRKTALTGGGLVRSAGGWAEVKKLRDNGYEILKGDERILGDGHFVKAVLAKTL